MATERKPAGRPAIELAPAAERGERWWPVAVAIIVVAFLHVILPARYRIQPAWVVPAVLLALLAVLIAGDPGRIDRQKTWLRVVTSLVIAFITLANLFAAARAHHPDRNPAFVFPEMQHTEYVAAGWVPRFVDYMSLSFWTAMAFSPTDISAIKPWAKLLMMLEAAGSLALAALVIARAINIL
ncbi:MAG TPA: hypothetical protein VLL69_14650 [Streptosporangiaceae bacterium]|nr:hypothetical protein [Streptosporangiaceae bacterium]